MIGKNPQVSILISVYNEEANIDDCLASIQAQIFPDFEIICVNDKSSDKTLDKLTKWQATFGRDKFILVSNAANVGLTKSLNLALLKARGKYIARIDADDTWHKNKLARQFDFLEKNPAYGIVGCNHTNYFKNNRNKKIVKLPENHKQISSQLFRRNPFAHSCILAQTELIRNVGAYDENIRYGQDYDLWLRCFPLTRFYNIQENLCVRKIDDLSSKKQKLQMLQSIRTRFKYIRKYNFGWKNYLYLLEPLTVAMTPNFIKKLKRRYL